MVRGIQGTYNVMHAKSKNRWRVFIDKEDGGVIILATGRTLIEALMMRDWCQANGWRKYVYYHQYIQKRPDGSFQIYKDFKTKNGYHRVYFGSYHTLEDAIIERDLLVKYDWDFETVCALG